MIRAFYLCNVLGKVLKRSSNKTFLVLIDLSDGVDLLNTLGAKLNTRREEFTALVLVQRALNESGLSDTLLTLGSAKERVGHPGTGISHRKSGGTSAILCLNDLITTELDAVDESIAGLTRDIGVVRLGKQGNNGNT